MVVLCCVLLWCGVVWSGVSHAWNREAPWNDPTRWNPNLHEHRLYGVVGVVMWCAVVWGYG